MNRAIAQLCLSMFGLAVAMITSVSVMIYGWGLEPKSWFWIIAVTLFGHIFAQAMIEVGKLLPNEKGEN